MVPAAAPNFFAETSRGASTIAPPSRAGSRPRRGARRGHSEGRTRRGARRGHFEGGISPWHHVEKSEDDPVPRGRFRGRIAVAGGRLETVSRADVPRADRAARRRVPRAQVRRARGARHRPRARRGAPHRAGPRGRRDGAGQGHVSRTRGRARAAAERKSSRGLQADCDGLQADCNGLQEDDASRPTLQRTAATALARPRDRTAPAVQ